MNPVWWPDPWRYPDDRPYDRNEQGYPRLVVLGSLTAILLAGMVRVNRSKRIVRFRFQGLAPLFDLHPFRLVGQPEGDTVVLDAYGPDGKNAKHASAESG